MADLGNTQFFTVEVEKQIGVKEVLQEVYEAMTEKGYNPVNEIVGYIMSGDPTYITRIYQNKSVEVRICGLWDWISVRRLSAWPSAMSF